MVLFIELLLSISFFVFANGDDDNFKIVDETEAVQQRRGRRGKIQSNNHDQQATNIDPQVPPKKALNIDPNSNYESNIDKNRDKRKKSQIDSSMYALWITPFEIFDFSNNPLDTDIVDLDKEELWRAAENDTITEEQQKELIVHQLSDVFVSSMIHKSFSNYAINAYYRFKREISNSNHFNMILKEFEASFGDGNDDSSNKKATINDKWFFIQKWYFNHKNETKYQSSINSQFIYDSIFPFNSYNVFKKGLYLVIIDYLMKSNVLTQEIHSVIYKKLFINDDLFIWSTIQNNNTLGHAMHFHEESLISGVYYTQLPLIMRKGQFIGGRLSLHDPRQSGIWPFDDRFIFTPKQGQIILFPGYLVHHVEPILNNEIYQNAINAAGTMNQDRISFAFNIKGNWDDLTDLSMTFDRTHKF